MKIVEILIERSTTNITQPKLWYMTERSLVNKITEDGVLYPTSTNKLSGQYDNRLHFFTKYDEATLEEIEALILFGGKDLDERSDVELVIFEVDMASLQEFDESKEIDRTWYIDDNVTNGVWTTNAVPFDRIIKYTPLNRVR